MDDQIKPVAWMLDTDSCTSLSAPLAQANRGGSHTEPLYSQQSIDALRADYERAEGLALRSIERRMAMEAEAEALRSDAERYRWLRDEAMGQKGMTPAVILATENFDVDVGECGGFKFGPDLDTAIDAARKGAE